MSFFSKRKTQSIIEKDKDLFLRRKLFTSLRGWKPLTPPLHIISVNQQIFVMKNVSWTMLLSTYYCLVRNFHKN
jgi:hypothetical protein